MSQDLLNQIRSEASQSTITLDQLITAFKEGSSNLTIDETTQSNPNSPQKSRFNLTNIVAYVGGLVIGMGISIIIGAYWDLYSDFVRLFLTLGLGLGFFMLANGIMLKFSRYNVLANICHLVAGLLIPSGVFYFLSLLPPSSIDTNLVIGCVFLGLGLLYLITDLIFKKGLTILYTIIYFSLSFWAFFGLILSNSTLEDKVFDYRLIQWGFLFTSVVYLLVAFCSWNWSRKWFAHLTLNIGVICFYVSVFTLVYYSEGYQRVISDGGSATVSETVAAAGSWILELLFGAIYVPFYILATRINSRWLLLITTLSLITWLIYLNSRYFFGGINFGVGLITSGLIMIGVSIGSIKLSAYLRGRSKVF